LYLLDTNICIDFVDGRNERARQRIRAARAGGLRVSTITAGELLVGAKVSDDPERDRERAERFLGLMILVDFDRRAAEAYGDLARTVGVKRKSFDRLIAAHALALGLTVVTNNESDFSDVPGLRVENWTLPA
jgi:tRNA(fMet)-specific endonuclease VapC